MENKGFKLNLKYTDGKCQTLEVDETMTIDEVKVIINAEKDVPVEKIKLVFKGKMLKDGDTLSASGITKPSTIVVVFNKFEKQKPQEQPRQSIPTNFQTGLGSFNPVGFSNYEIVNHPQYMSTLSGLTEDKVEEMLDDPFYQSMIEELMKDPDTMIRMMEENPMTRKMMKDNPMMKAMLSNPETLKMMMNPEMLKMAREMKKNPNAQQQLLQGNMGGMGGFGMPGMGMPGMGYGMMPPMGQWPPVTNPTNPSGQPNPVPPPNLQQMNFPNPAVSMNWAPWLSMMNPAGTTNKSPATTAPASTTSPTVTSTSTSQTKQQQKSAPSPTKKAEQQKVSQAQASKVQASPEPAGGYQSQMERLTEMGFTDTEKMLKALKLANGNVDDAVDYLDE